MSRFPRLLSLLLAASTTLCAASLAAHPASTDADGNAMQMLADATVIDAECRTTNTMYGALFLYGEEHGVQEDDILLSGKRRQEFEAAMTGA